uniref:Uncharacterized protein n=1 Tax=Trichogramma kaykai TaxID=54128 RepID=A0ABD2XHH4_9HYME
MERYKERMQMLLQNVTARGMWTKVEEMSAENVMISLRNKRLSEQGGEQICRERLSNGSNGRSQETSAGARHRESDVRGRLRGAADENSLGGRAP